METGDIVPSRSPTERVGDAERDQVATLLREHCTAGRLTLDEFSERVAAALAAHTRGELDATLADLPSTLPARPDTATTKRRARRALVAIMSESSERGRYLLDTRTTAVAVMGSCQLDLRQAIITGREVEITAVAVMGSVEIIVPEGIETDVIGFAVMGSKDLHVRDLPPIPGSPRVIVRAFPVMGSVEVKSRPVGALDRYSRHPDRLFRR